MSATAAVPNPQETKIALVLDALSRDGELSVGELALLDELGRVPEIRAAVAERESRQHWARVEAARAVEAQREADRAERVEARRAQWRAADPLVRACHVLAERLHPDRQAKILLQLAELVTNPRETLLTKKRYELGKSVPREERAPPLSFEPTGRDEFDDPITE
jgi:hypothetical protein